MSKAAGVLILALPLCLVLPLSALGQGPSTIVPGPFTSPSGVDAVRLFPNDFDARGEILICGGPRAGSAIDQIARLRAEYLPDTDVLIRELSPQDAPSKATLVYFGAPLGADEAAAIPCLAAHKTLLDFVVSSSGTDVPEATLNKEAFAQGDDGKVSMYVSICFQDVAPCLLLSAPRVLGLQSSFCLQASDPCDGIFVRDEE